MWKVEEEENYFKIYDSRKDLAGYFDPDFGAVEDEEQIEKMLKNHAEIQHGFLYIPMVKFNVFSEKNMSIDHLENSVRQALDRINMWRRYLSGSPISSYGINVSHTDSDMLGITLEIRFQEKIRLDKRELAQHLAPILDGIQDSGLL